MILTCALIGPGGAACHGPSAAPATPAALVAPVVTAQAVPLTAATAMTMAAVAPVVREPLPPWTLTASDGSGLVLSRVDARAVLEGPLAFTELHLYFRNDEDRVREGTFQIVLPSRAAVSRFAMESAGQWMEAEVVPKLVARRAYDDFLHRRQDPALLEKAPGNQFTARVFPIAARATKHLVISYSQELPGARYTLPLRGLPAVEQVDVELRVTGREGVRTERLARRDWQPDRDFVADVPRTAPGVGTGVAPAEPVAVAAGNLVAAEVEVGGAAAASDVPRGVTLLVDTSASRALGFDAYVAAVRGLIDELRRRWGAALPLAVIAFDQDSELVFAGRAADFGDAERRRLVERGAAGASDLGQALAWIAEPARHTVLQPRMVIVGDGVVTAGAEGKELAAAVAQLSRAGVERLDVALAGGLRDERTAAQLVRAGLPRAGAVLDLEADPVAAALAEAIAVDAPVEVAGAAWVSPRTIASARPGTRVMVHARLTRPAAENATKIDVTVGGRRRTLPVVTAARPLVERAIAGAEIAELEARLPGLAGDEAAAVRRDIAARSVAARVLSSETSLLVLETDADYTRYGIARTALADVLVVGAGGVESMHRTGGGEFAAADRGGPRTTRREPAPASRDGQAQRNPAPAQPDAAPTLHGRVTRSQAASRPAPGARQVQPDPEPSATTPSGEQVQRSGAPAGLDGRAPAQEAAASAGDDAPDADHDGIPDDEDGCPDEPETYNGHEDGDGCPDRGRVVLTSASIEVLDYVYFAARSVAVERAARPALDAVAATLQRNPDIMRVEVQGHSDERGDERENLALSERRAAAVVEYLVAAGVAAQRLVAVGYGASQPVDRAHGPAAWARNRRVGFLIVQRGGDEPAVAAGGGRAVRPEPPPAVTGELAAIEQALAAHEVDAALVRARDWHARAPGDVLALIGLGEALEARGADATAARIYGSIIDLFPARADMRRFAGERLARLPAAQRLAIDTFRRAVADRPDHVTGHRLLAYALVRAGRVAEGFAAILAGLDRAAVGGPRGGVRVLGDDASMIGAAYAAAAPARRAEIAEALARRHLAPAAQPSTRVVLYWETDANDVDLHVEDARGGHASFRAPRLASGGELYADVTTGYGPECFAIAGTPQAGPYRISLEYYAQGPMGYGMGLVEIQRFDPARGFAFDDRPYVIMSSHATVELGSYR